MDFNTAKEIYYSPDKIEVFHQGKPVWMYALDETNNTVEIKYINTRDTVAKVRVEELTKGKTIG
ncbi:MAG: Small acid-soluble spore protein family [Clostridiales bacterium]|jgi:H-type small acid-soluble spore protein|nr:Small acid-soluble spore protein family [Clostridiales bacterium]